MTTIHANYYNFNRQQYPRVAAALKHHLSVKKPEHRTSVFSEVDLEKATNEIPDTPTPNESIRFKLSWNEGAMFAYDMGLTETLPRMYDGADEQSKENLRYHMPRSQGTTRIHTFQIFGQEVNSCGDYPFQIIMIGDLNYDLDPLSLLQDWKQVLDEEPERFLDKIIDVGKDMQGASRQGDAFLSLLPRSQEGFDSDISNAQKYHDLDMIHSAISMTRFFHDFIIVPTEGLLGNPDSVEFTGGHSFKLSISPNDIEVMCGRPTESLEEVLKQLFPKQRDDITLSRTIAST